MIVWSGHGYLVAVFVFGISLLMELGTESAFNDENYYQTATWPFPLALAMAGAVCLVAGLCLATVNERRLIDPETNEEVVISANNHTFFFITIHWWGAILMAIAAVLFVVRFIAPGGV
jgi:hypothetical protein